MCVRSTSLRAPRAAALTLQAAVLVQSATLLWLAWRHGTSVDSFLFMQVGTSEALARGVDRGLATLALGAALVLLVRPSALPAVTVAAVFLLAAVAVRLVGGRAFSDLAPAAHATRWVAPLALAALVAARSPQGPRAAAAPSARQLAAAVWLLRLAVAATFLAHGWEALRAHPAFVDLLLGSARRWTGTAPTESTARAILVAVGVGDVAVALAILATRWRWVALWATLWGLLTAASRTVALGDEFLHESLARLPNALAPLALWLLLPRRPDGRP